MAIVVHVDDLIRDLPPADDDGGDPHPGDPGALGRLWCMILLMAVRDHAMSVHYHPWREDGGLAYVVGGDRIVLQPPRAESAEAVLAAARSLFTEPIRGGWLARLCRRTKAGAACASVALDVRGDVFVWDAVVWSSGGRSGVELFRVAPGVAPRLPDAGS